MRRPSDSSKRSEMMMLVRGPAEPMCFMLHVFWSWPFFFVFVFGLVLNGQWVKRQRVELSDFQRVEKWREISTAS